MARFKLGIAVGFAAGWAVGSGRATQMIKQLQASSELLYDVFTRYDPDNLLVTQAHREVLERQLEQSRLGRALDRVAGGRTTVVEVERPTPLAFPPALSARINNR